MSDGRLKYRVRDHVYDLLSAEAEEKLGPITEIHGAEVHKVGDLLIQLWIKDHPGSPRRIIEIKVSEPVT